MVIRRGILLEADICNNDNFYIHCFKNSQICKTGKDILNNRLSILMDTGYWFISVDANDVAAAPNFLTVNPSHEDIEIAMD